MFLISLNSMIIIIIPMIIMKLSIMMSKKMKMDNEKMSPFECGFSPIFKARIPFSLRFFLITIIFLIFDIEIALLLPMIITFFSSNLVIWMITMNIFIMILILGIYYEWYKGALNWM